MKRSRRLYLPAAFFSILLLPASLQAQRPALRYQQTVEANRIESRVRAFATACLETERLPKPVQLYAQGAWFVTADLAAHIKEQGSDDDGTAQVWEQQGQPRAVSLWVHDDEFDRSTLACLDNRGVVTRQINEYMPGNSEPDLHWIFVHTFTLEAGKAAYREASYYTDWNRTRIHAPKLTSEDRDFIAGERRYKHWSDFDFARAVAQNRP